MIVYAQNVVATGMYTEIDYIFLILVSMAETDENYTFPRIFIAFMAIVLQINQPILG